MFKILTKTKALTVSFPRRFSTMKLVFLTVLISAITFFLVPGSRADECSTCSVRSDSLIGGGGFEYLVQQQEADVSPFNAELKVGGLYDSRVGSASGSGDDEDDTALTVRLSAGWQGAITENAGIRFDYRGYADFHRDYDEYNIIDQSVSIEPLYKAGSFIFSVPISFNIAWEDGDHEYNRYAVSPTLTYMIPDTRQAVAIYGVCAKIQDKDDDEFLDEDGKTLGGGLAYLYFFPNKSRVRLSVDYQKTEYDAFLWHYGKGTSASQEKRENESIVAGVDALIMLARNFGLYASYSYIHSTSNLDMYEYNRHLVEGGLALKF